MNASQISPEMMSDGMSDDDPSSQESSFDASDLLANRVTDEVTAQLAAAGTVGMAAAAAIASSRKKKRPHQFEKNPSIRKRQQTRLLRKLKVTIEEYTTRVGQQAIVLCCTPGRISQSANTYKVFGSQPLEHVIRNCKGIIMQDLEASLAEHVSPHNGGGDSNMYDLPQLALDGIPTPVDKMTQAQLRTFIPEMLKFSTGRSKPGWGKPECRPPWWPDDVPWANVRSDVRTEEEKKRVSWTEALRTIVKNCYRYHSRDDLLNIFGEDGSVSSSSATNSTNHYNRTMVQTINNPDGTVSIIQIDTGAHNIVTLPDGTQATVVHTMTPLSQHDVPHHESSQAVQTLSEASMNEDAGENHMGMQITPVSIEMTADGTPQGITALADGRLVLSADATAITADGTGIVTIPVSMYQNMVAVSLSSANLQHQQQNIHITMSPQLEEALKNNANQNVAVHVVSVEPKVEPS
ncbi:hypothetical protein ACJMK2_015840 [Sinanodonta woodiana]|uniref:Nuclear respiratory factor 1 NLS/DNA-binding dimerisation domain-containing protein n=1 Tax=Sinanodonta woodiana TaxID=1069815 RepID=A0ABD3USX1_SINWO